MKPRIILVLVGALPLPVGYLTNHLIMTVWFEIFPAGWYWFTVLFFLSLWFVVGMASVKWIDSKIEALLYLNAIAGVFFMLIFFQEIVLGRFGLGWVGISSQFYFLPLSLLPSRLLRFIPFVPIQFTYISLVAFGCQLLASYYGRRIGEGRTV